MNPAGAQILIPSNSLILKRSGAADSNNGIVAPIEYIEISYTFYYDKSTDW